MTGEGLAVSRQREDCERLARERGWTIVEVYEDNSLSASNPRTRRPAYDRMVDDFAVGRFTAIVCWDLDRLTRQPRQLEDWIDAAEKCDLRLVTANGEADLTTDGGRMYARIKAAVARAEIERKGARQRRAAEQRAKAGMPAGGARPMGYTLAGELVLDEAAIVRELFDGFLHGESLKGLVRDLTARAVPTRRGRPWSTASVHTILSNPRYAGLATYRGIETGRPGRWAAIVPVEQFRIVQSRLSEPGRRTQQGTDRKHLGSSLYRCWLCDGLLVSCSGTSYRCRQTGHVSRRQRAVDRFVLDVVRARLATPEIVSLMAGAQNDPRVQELAAESHVLRARLDQVGADYDLGLIDGARYASARSVIETSLQRVETERAGIVGSAAAASTLAAPDPVSAFDSKSLMVQRAVVDALCTIHLRKGQRGSRVFDPATVTIEWKQ